MKQMISTEVYTNRLSSIRRALDATGFDMTPVYEDPSRQIYRHQTKQNYFIDISTAALHYKKPKGWTAALLTTNKEIAENKEPVSLISENLRVAVYLLTTTTCVRGVSIIYECIHPISDIWRFDK